MLQYKQKFRKKNEKVKIERPLCRPKINVVELIDETVAGCGVLKHWTRDGGE